MSVAGRQRTVLIITGPDDPSADVVQDALAAHSVPAARLDTGSFPAGMSIFASNVGSGWHGRAQTGHGGVELEETRSIYYRRPTRFTFPATMSAADTSYAEAEARFGIGGIFSALNCLYVNHPHANARAEYKPVQHVAAEQAGLQMPATLITNDHAAALKFAEEVNGPVVCKTLSSLVLGDRHGNPQITYTTPVAVSDIEPRSFAATAHCLQAWVAKLWDARVTMVGSRPYGVAIHAHTSTSRIDWRADYSALQYSIVHPPDEVTTGMRAYLDAMGLSFGAFDFAIDSSGFWWFLECNPAGQWLWLEHQTGVKISDGLAELLATGRGK